LPSGLLRLCLGYKQADAAEAFGVSAIFLSEVESGQRTIRPQEARRIAVALGVPEAAERSVSIVLPLLSELERVPEQ
jgi:transcriptional regulator with XRE-family HTH domain